MAGSLEGRSVVVTGGTGALGSAVTAALLAEGATVHIPTLEAETPAHFEFGEHARVRLRHGVDLTDEGQVVDYYASLASGAEGGDGGAVGDDDPRGGAKASGAEAPLFASIQIAGGFAMAPLVDTPLAELERIWRMNLVSCFLCCREAVRLMRGSMRATGVGGRLVNVAARPALIPTAGMVAYATAKAAVAALTTALAEELADEGIWVNAIAPSIIDTPANRAAMPDADHDRWPKPAELARVICELAGPTNGCVRGAVVPVFGRG